MMLAWQLTIMDTDTDTDTEQEIWANAHETRENLQQFQLAGNLGLYPSISSQFSILLPKIAKNHWNPLVGVQDDSRSSMLIPLKSTPPVLVMINSKPVPICNCFRA